MKTDMRAKGQWNMRWTLASLLLLLLLILGALLCGRYGISLKQLWQVCFCIGAEDGKQSMVRRVLWQIRLPRICFALAAGAGLAAAGAAFQGICANPLATPDTLGVANGASFGAALGILLGLDGFGIQVTAMLCGMLAVVLVFLVSRKQSRDRILMLVLAGMAVSSLFSAMLSFVKYMADPQNTLPVITHWLMGSMNAVTWKTVKVGLPWIAAGCAMILLLRWQLNALSLSDEEARSLGVRPALVRLLLIPSASMVTAAVVAACGQIGWIGLLIPHGCRLLFGSDYRQNVPASLCFGAAFLLIVDTAARTVSAAEIPVSILTAVIGAPVFLLLLHRKEGLSL